MSLFEPHGFTHMACSSEGFPLSQVSGAQHGSQCAFFLEVAGSVFLSVSELDGPSFGLCGPNHWRG